MVSDGCKNSDCLQDHLNSRNWGIWTGKLNAKRIILQQSNYTTSNNKMGKDKAKGKEQYDGETTATSETVTSPQDAHWDARQSTRNLSWDRKARDATLAKITAEAVTRKMAKAHAHYQAILNERGTATLQTSLKVSSGTNGFKVMNPFNWTKDKSIYQRWQLWSEKARLTLDAMEGDSGKTNRVATFRFRLNSLCFPCVHDQFPCVFHYINNKYYFYKWPPPPLTAILSSLLFNNNITS